MVISLEMHSFPTGAHDRCTGVVLKEPRILGCPICLLFATAGTILTASRRSLLVGQAMYLKYLTMTFGWRIECLVISSSMDATHVSLNGAANCQATFLLQTKWLIKASSTEEWHWQKKFRWGRVRIPCHSLMNNLLIINSLLEVLSPVRLDARIYFSEHVFRKYCKLSPMQIELVICRNYAR